MARGLSCRCMASFGEILASHYEEHLGTSARRQTFRRAAAAVEVWTWDPVESGEGVWLHVSLGASAELGADRHHGHEFFIGLTQDLEGVDRRLASLAGYRYETGIELGPGHGVPADNPLWPNTGMSALLVMRPREPIIPDLVLDDGRHTVFLQAIPLYRSELGYKTRRGAEALMAEFERLQVPFWGATRPCCPLD